MLSKCGHKPQIKPVSTITIVVEVELEEHTFKFALAQMEVVFFFSRHCVLWIRGCQDTDDACLWWLLFQSLRWRVKGVGVSGPQPLGGTLANAVHNVYPVILKSLCQDK